MIIVLLVFIVVFGFRVKLLFVSLDCWFCVIDCLPSYWILICLVGFGFIADVVVYCCIILVAWL